MPTCNPTRGSQTPIPWAPYHGPTKAATVDEYVRTNEVRRAGVPTRRQLQQRVLEAKGSAEQRQKQAGLGARPPCGWSKPPSLKCYRKPDQQKFCGVLVDHVAAVGHKQPRQNQAILRSSCLFPAPQKHTSSLFTSPRGFSQQRTSNSWPNKSDSKAWRTYYGAVKGSNGKYALPARPQPQ